MTSCISLRVVGFLTAALTFVGLPSMANALVIDSFDYTASAASNATLVDASVLGGEVDFYINNPGSVPDGTIAVNGATATVVITGRSFPSSSFGNVTFSYDGLDAVAVGSSFGLGPLDLSSTLGLEFEVKALNASGDVRFQAQAFTSSGSGFSFVDFIADVGKVNIPWGTFDTIGASDLSEIRAFALTFIMPVDASITIDNFIVSENQTSVPEPTSLLLLGLGLGGVYSRRKSKAA